MDRECTPDPIAAAPILGSLLYIDRKSGEVKQNYPIDAEKITFGRDADCDIRLHWEDVSRVHAEINFDLLEGTATLSVLGSNGLYFVSSGQPRVKLETSARQQLQSGDSFTIRKRLFRFEYPTDTISAAAMSPSILGTPARRSTTPAKPTAAATPIRRRASHRLSLMPADKPFVPLSPMKRRQSNAGQTGSTPKRSHLGQQVEEDEDEIMEGIVDVQQNEDGDMIILETREDTPVVVQKPSPVPPKTPRSIPLPPPTQTPYVQTPPRVPIKVAMSTPPGPMTLHKALLLRSARKAWVESRPNDVEDAVADGKIEVGRRKSKSPSKDDPLLPKRKSLTPRPSVAPEPDSDISDDDEVEQQAVIEDSAGVQSAARDVQEAPDLFDDDSADESMEADLSLDIPVPTVFVYHGEEENANAIGHLYDGEEEGEYFEEAAESQEDDDNVEVREEAEEADHFSVEEHVASSSTPVSVSLTSDPKVNALTRQTRTLDRFYTPQVSRHHNQPRRSLAAIGGPATRAFGVPASPNPLGGGAFRPTPSKAHMPAALEEEDEEEGDSEDTMQAPTQPSLSDRELAEIKRRRQSLATPRQLPVAPMSFREPVKNGFSLVKTPSHPALTRSPTKGDDDEHDDTPVGDIKSRLNKMKRDSYARELARPVDKSNRRATVGFVLPETPVRPLIKASASYTAAPASRFGNAAPPTPKTPVVRPNEEECDSAISSLHQTPVRTTTKKVGTPFSLYRRSPIPEIAESEVGDAPASPEATKSPRGASTPDRSRASAREPKPMPQTPYMGDIKGLYPTIPDQASPVLAGIKNLYPSLPLPPKTPDMRGMKNMFAQQQEAEKTPGMEGLEEMFASPVRHSPQRQPVLEVADEVLDSKSPRGGKRASVAQQASVEKEGEVVGASATAVDQGQDDAEADEPAIQTATSSRRSTKAATVKSEPKPAPARTRAVAPPRQHILDVEKVSAPSRRRIAASASAAPAAETKSKPTRRAAPAAVEPEPVQEKGPVVAVSKPTRARATSAKISSSSASMPVSPEPKSAPAPRGRPKKILAEAAEQVVPPKPSATTSKPARTRTAPTPVADAAERRTVSAPTRRTRVVKEDEGEKENVAEEKSAPVRAGKTRVTKKEVVVEVAVTTTRATRSRK